MLDALSRARLRWMFDNQPDISGSTIKPKRNLPPAVELNILFS